MHNILLFIVCVLLIGDLVFLKRLIKMSKNNSKVSENEKYFELKYHINLLKSTSAILLFVIGYFGYSSYKDLKTNIKTDFEKNIQHQKDEIESVSLKIKEINTSIDSLKELKNSLELVVNDYQNRLTNISQKILSINNSTKYNRANASKIFFI